MRLRSRSRKAAAPSERAAPTWAAPGPGRPSGHAQDRQPEPPAEPHLAYVLVFNKLFSLSSVWFQGRGNEISVACAVMPHTGRPGGGFRLQRP